ncbi:hypothetical protein KM043_008419 [Ampulex compressa]|nr:hypothetical protein KM043_008419 [Ampulex compressa]
MEKRLIHDRLPRKQLLRARNPPKFPRQNAESGAPLLSPKTRVRDERRIVKRSFLLGTVRNLSLEVPLRRGRRKSRSSGDVAKRRRNKPCADLTAARRARTPNYKKRGNRRRHVEGAEPSSYLLFFAICLQSKKRCKKRNPIYRTTENALIGYVTRNDRYLFPLLAEVKANNRRIPISPGNSSSSVCRLRM